MSFVICMVAAAPLRKEEAHRSEMISQVLFGELAEVLEDGKQFTRIRCVYDGYEGWCQRNQLAVADPSLVNTGNTLMAPEWHNMAALNGQPLHLSLGTSLGMFHHNKLQVGDNNIVYLGKIWDTRDAVFAEDNIRSLAIQFINTPYLWGGRSIYGIDCSGFSQLLFRFFNIRLPRDAYQQAAEGEVVGFLQEAVCGDLAFFDNEEGKITHVGILFAPDIIIHASGKVRIDKIDNMGIINTDTGERTHTLRIVKRYMPGF